jgi:signal transduction histidine kinase/CheY-like chemotaxis protein
MKKMDTRAYEGKTAEAMPQTQADERLKSMTGMWQILTSISGMLAGAPLEGIPREVDNSLRVLASYGKEDRCILFLLSGDRLYLDKAHLWSAEGARPFPGHFSRLRLDAFPWLKNRLELLKPIHAPRVEDLPLEAGPWKDFLLGQGVCSLLVIPLVHGGAPVGCLSIECTSRHKVWDQEAVSLLMAAAGTMAGACMRKRAEEEKARLEQWLIQAQKMESIGTLAGGIAHDFNNLLTGILGNLSLVLLDMDGGNPLHDRLKSIEEYLRRGSDLTRQLLGFARRGPCEIRPMDLGSFMQESIEMFGRARKEIRIRFTPRQGLWAVEADRGQMEQVLLNLYVNAWQAMPEGGGLHLSVENAELDEGGAGPHGVSPGKYVKVVVADTGIGMDEATRARIFEPFFTTKERGSGTGLGLASAYCIVRNLGGFITVESRKGVGSSFTIHLPASDREAETTGRREDGLLRGRETILLVDDEDVILDTCSTMLEGLGYTVLTASGGRQAIHVYEQDRDRISLVILDMIMPDCSGRETFDTLRALDPSARVLLTSGYCLNSQAKAILESGCRGFIHKPFTLVELSKKIRGILDE